jgi:ribonuclease D
LSHPQHKFISFPGKIHVIGNDRDLDAIELTRVEAFGFDTETRPSFKKGDNFKTALLQLATDEVAYLFRLHHLTKFQKVREVFENASVLKVGAAIAHDLRQLQKIFPFRPSGFVDIQKVAKEKMVKNMGLKGMMEEVVGASLTKGPKMTNWEKADLTDAQLLYAATDAWAGLELYRHLQRRPAASQPS